MIIVAILGLFSASAQAGRTVYIPPIFSNKDFECPAADIHQLVTCWDFSLTNLSPVGQTVSVTMRNTSFIDGSISGGKRSPAATLATTLNFPANATGTSLQAGFCAVCTSLGCNWGVSSVPLGGPGGVASPTDGAHAKTGFYHAEVVLQVDVAEDRGALIGRVNQRLYSDPNQNKAECRDSWTSPQVVVELNGGRAF